MSNSERLLSCQDGLDYLTGMLKSDPGRLLLLGVPGSGKSRLAADLARRLEQQQIVCHCLSADPGSPALGVPGAVNLGLWHGDHWQPLAFEPLCSLNAARFRLPLIEAVRTLLGHCQVQHLLIDAPGLVRGVAAAELLAGLIAVCRPTQLVLVSRDKRPCGLEQELAAAALPLLRLINHDLPPPRRHQRARQRTERWLHYLGEDTQIIELSLAKLSLLGTPPPLDCREAWQGRLVALLDGPATLAMGEVEGLGDSGLKIRCPPLPRAPRQLLIRDARRLQGQPLATVEPLKPPTSARGPELVRRSGRDHHPGTDSPLRVRTREAIAELVNGVYGDPLLLLRPNQQRRCLLFDLGHTAGLSLRYAHRVSDIFISHAHIDHIGGFMGLLRARISAPATCRLYGPPGLSRHIGGMLSGILWDRIGAEGPGFEVAELHGERLQRWRFQAGIDGSQPLPERPAANGVILTERGFRVRATELDHRTPVLAYAYEPETSLRINIEALHNSELQPGPWLSILKTACQQGRMSERIALPDGKDRPVSELAEQLLNTSPGDRIVYATDLADTPTNRRRLVSLARKAHTLFCEACFSAADDQRAADCGHLTTRACGEIAASSDVKQLVPFHFSRRYERQPEQLYREIESAFAGVVKAT